MSDPLVPFRHQLARQVAHWTAAARRLQSLDDLASHAAWKSLEMYLGMSLRRHLEAVVAQLDREAGAVQGALDAAATAEALGQVRRQLLAFRRRYLLTETTLDFFAAAINSRTSTRVAGYLRACDTIAHRSMAQLLDPLGRPVPSALTYVGKGLGASVLRAGGRLWDGTGVNPVAAIKVTRHNLLRPTALVHEAGHQVAHIVGWNDELAAVLRSSLADEPDVADAFSGWSSEIAADAFSFVTTGYGSVAALHDVLAGDDAHVYLHAPGDPHPVGWLRVLLGVEMCGRAFRSTSGPWSDLATSWMSLYPIERAPNETRRLLETARPLLPRVADAVLSTPMRAFGGRALDSIVDPRRVRPEELLRMEAELGPALYGSMHWIWTESLRLLALTSLRMATEPDRKQETLRRQEEWMLRLGGVLQVA